MTPVTLDVRPEVRTALAEGKPVVALESTLIAHGLPWPANLETARAAEAAVRAEGAVPATIAVWRGTPAVGLSDAEIAELAQERDVLKASRRDLGAAIAQRRTAATTVAATMYLAHRAGIRVFATGGIGGVHRGEGKDWDVSADLVELARTPVAVVCAGAKSILDLRNTLEMLETLAVPVAGYQTGDFPAFYVRKSGEPVAVRVDTPEQAADLLEAHWALEGCGVVIAQPVAAEAALDAAEWARVLQAAEGQARAQGVHGKEVTPFLLARVAELTEGKSLRANQALILANARLAARIARALAQG
jgi:pseudouridine-5'-phosphate glycosidase